MSAHGVLEAALADALGSHAPLRSAVNGIHLMRPVRATPPFISIGESLSGDWGTKDQRGREVRTAFTITDAAESPARLYRLMADAEDAVETLARDLDGWRVVSVAFLRSRVNRNAAREWMAMVEYRVRMLGVG